MGVLRHMERVDLRPGDDGGHSQVGWGRGNSLAGGGSGALRGRWEALRGHSMRERCVRAFEGCQSGSGRRAAVDPVVTAKAIRGRGPVHNVGDRVVLREGYRQGLE